MLAWKPELGTRIAVIRRDGTGSTRWIHNDAFWVWHFANAHEQGDRISLDFPMWTAPGFLRPASRTRLRRPLSRDGAQLTAAPFARTEAVLSIGQQSVRYFNDGPRGAATRR